MPIKLDYSKSAYLSDREGIEKCEDTTIGALIKYLQQFPPNWPIILDHINKEEFVLVDTGLTMSLQMRGEDMWHMV